MFSLRISDVNNEPNEFTDFNGKKARASKLDDNNSSSFDTSSRSTTNDMNVKDGVNHGKRKISHVDGKIERLKLQRKILKETDNDGANIKMPIAVMYKYDHESDVTTRRYVYIDKRSDGPSEFVIESTSDSEFFEPIPLLTQRQVWRCYISGKSGSGKSTRIAELVDNMRDLNKTINNVVMFNANNIADPAYERLGVRVMDYEKVKLLEVMQVEDFKNSIIIFDDWDQIVGPNSSALIKHMRKFLKAVLERGRKFNVHALVVSHQTMDFLKTRDIISECESCALFPAMNRRNTFKFIKEYLDDSKGVTEMARKLAAGSYGTNEYDMLYVNKAVPMYAVSDKAIRIFND